MSRYIWLFSLLLLLVAKNTEFGVTTCIFKLTMHQNPFSTVSGPDPTVGAYDIFPDPLGGYG